MRIIDLYNLVLILSALLLASLFEPAFLNSASAQLGGSKISQPGRHVVRVAQNGEFDPYSFDFVGKPAARLKFAFPKLNQHDPIARIAEAGCADPAFDEQILPGHPSIAEAFEDDKPVKRHKDAFLQRVELIGTWISGSGLSLSEVTASAAGAIPLGSLENLLIVSPYMKVTSLNGPPAFDAPEQLYDTGVRFLFRKEFTERWQAVVLVAPTIRTDFQTSADNFYIFGAGLVTWTAIPEKLQLSLGGVYLDRADLPFLPGAGLKWTPRPDWELDLNYPRPKLSKRILKNGDQDETWTYIAGGLGGNTWTVERTPGIADKMTLRDFRVALGIEKIIKGGSGWNAELGYVAGRKIEYESTATRIRFDDSFSISLGLRY